MNSYGVFCINKGQNKWKNVAISYICLYNTVKSLLLI